MFFLALFRLVSEIHMEKKMKNQKKSKSSDGRKQLSSVRVIQRNLVYIVGLPLNLADEDVIFLPPLLSSTWMFLSCSQILVFPLWSVDFFPLEIFYLYSFAASPAARVLCSVWEGLKSVDVSDSSWCHSTVSKWYLQCVSALSSCLWLRFFLNAIIVFC